MAWPLGEDLRGLHVAVEVLWLALLGLFGSRYLATAYVGAFWDATSVAQACPSAQSCGAFTGWLTFANLVPAVLIVLGYAGAQWSGDRPRRSHWYKHLYWTGSVLGLVLIAVQVVLALIGLHLLQSTDRVSTGSNGSLLTVQVDVDGPPPPPPPRRLAETVPAEISLDNSTSYAEANDTYVAVSLRPRTCSGNRDPADDVLCTYPSTLVADAASRQASDEQRCCEKVGLCRGNTDGSPDVRCEAPASALPADARGRDPESCCAIATCAQVECVPPKVAKALDPSTIQGSTVEECCVCAQDGERDLVDAYCVNKEDSDPTAENRCTDVMKYVGCGRFESGQWVSRSTHCVDHPEDSECVACKSEPPFLEFQRLAETQGSAQDLCMDADRYTCRYIFRRTLEVISCREGMCFDNTFADAEPDIVCPPPWARASHAMDRVGRDVESCCTISGRCIQDSDGEPDIECEFPSRLRPNAEMIIGRDQETCCHVTEMCVGNTDQAAEPNAHCQFPAVLRPDASRRFRRAENPCDGCCVTEDMCVDNDICEADIHGSHLAQRDVVCREPAELVPNAAITRGRDAESCCRTVGRCVGNTDDTPDVHCTWPALLKNNAEVLFGSTEGECCLTQGMCAGNSNTQLEPDVICETPAVPRENSARIAGRTANDCCVVSGYCAGNTDPAEEDIVCDGPRTPKGNLREIRGRDHDTCCDCFEVSEEVSQEYCVLTDDAKPELDNQCTRVMKYAGCDDMEACIRNPDLPECVVCAEHEQEHHSAFQIMARDHRAQEVCMAAGRYECTYIFGLEEVTTDPCFVTGKCIGNTNRVDEPNVVCPAPTRLRTNAAEITGNTPEECCTVTGMCTGNTEDATEPDVACPAPSQLLGPSHRGRSQAECCVIHGMCVGNTRAEEEPDYDCPAPFQLNANAAEIRGRSMDACCWCEEHTETIQQAFCYKTDVPDPDTDNECTEVMRYADCPVSCVENGYSIAETEELVPECAACAQEPPYASWQQLAQRGGAQDRCMDASRYGCTYIIDHHRRTSGCELLAPEPEPSPPAEESGTHTCGCQHSWLALVRYPATDDDERQAIGASSILVIVAFMLCHFVLRLYKVLWHYGYYRYVSPCTPFLFAERDADYSELEGVGRDGNDPDRDAVSS